MFKKNMEFYYMSGLPIDFSEDGLGTIYQPKLKDLISSNIEISEFSHPFLLNKDMVLKRNEGVDEALSDIGRLKFLFVYDEITRPRRELEGSEGMIDTLTKCLKILYKTETVMVLSTVFSIVIGDSILINDSNFGLLADLVVEMMRIDIVEMRKKIQENKRREEEEKNNPMLREIRRREREYLARKQEKDELTIIDLANIVVHSQSIFDYEKVFDLTIYQLKNSYDLVMKKETYMVNLLHRISPNFQPTDDFKLWEEKAKVIKSGLSKQS